MVMREHTLVIAVCPWVFAGYEDRLNAVSGSQNFEEGYEKLQADLRKAQE